MKPNQPQKALIAQRCRRETMSTPLSDQAFLCGRFSLFAFSSLIHWTVFARFLISHFAFMLSITSICFCFVCLFVLVSPSFFLSLSPSQGLKVIDLQMPDFLRILENAVQFGSPVLLQNVQEELDPSLAPILNKSLTHVGGRLLMKLGDKEVEYSPEFRFYITTKLSNPHYTPEISTKTTIVNFAVKEQVGTCVCVCVIFAFVCVICVCR